MDCVLTRIDTRPPTKRACSPPGLPLQSYCRAALSCAMGLGALRPDAPAGLATPEARAICQYAVAASVLSFAVLASQLPKQPKQKAA